MEEKESSFRYTYSAQQQAEITRIREKYAPPAENKLEQLRKLDRIPGQKAQRWALTLGILGALILGTGMSLAMTDIGTLLGVSTSLSMLIGIPVGLLGIALVALAYPIYNRILKTQRKKLAPQILALTDTLLK